MPAARREFVRDETTGRLCGGAAAIAEAEAKRTAELRWPSQMWAERGPIRFAFEVLGVEKLSPDQRKILELVWKNKNVSISSGHKVGKSLALAIAALWFWCSFPEAKVMLAAVTEKQIERILWAEIRKLYRRARRLGRDLGGIMQASARFGLKSVDDDGTERVLWGVVATSQEAAAGLSGPNVFLIFDEASGIKDSFFEALGTSLASDGSEGVMVRRCYISNPTKTTGEFARSHNSATSEFVTCIISSENTPNALGDIANSIPGLAGPGWIEERKRVWGADSATYKIRVLGQFVRGEDGKILSELALNGALERWRNPEHQPGGLKALASWGRLYIGVDPAGPGAGGDESGFALRRDVDMLRVFAERGLTDEGHLVKVRELCAENRGPEELPPVVIVDRDGSVGAEVYGTLKAYANEHPHEFVVFGFRGSDPAKRLPDLYDTSRDELWANGAKWAKLGSLPQNAKLKEDLHFFEWTADERGRRMKASSKKEFRKELQRSPDRGDAALLSMWEPREVALLEERANRPPPGPDSGSSRKSTAINPYDGARARKSQISPYALDPRYRKGVRER